MSVVSFATNDTYRWATGKSWTVPLGMEDGAPLGGIQAPPPALWSPDPELHADSSEEEEDLDEEEDLLEEKVI